jgi:hypothetical protein
MRDRCGACINTRLRSYATACVSYKQAMQGALRDISYLAQSVDGNRLLKALVKMIQYTRELSRFPVIRSRNSRGGPGTVGCALPCDLDKKVQSRGSCFSTSAAISGVNARPVEAFCNSLRSAEYSRQSSASWRAQFRADQITIAVCG